MATLSVELKGATEIGWMREAGRIVAEVLAELSEAAAPGMSTLELDKLALDGIVKRKGKTAFLGYRGFTGTLCASINEEVVHGIPSAKRKLKQGDLLSLDLGAIVKGFYADAAVTISIGEIPERSMKLVETTRRSLEAAIAEVKPGARLGDVSYAVQKLVEAEGMSVVREFVGHGIGRALHEDPPVPNYGRPGVGLKLEPGLVIAIEPMVTLGGPKVKILDDGWTAVSADGSLSAHFEHTVAVTHDGCEVLTRIG
jgi:methionyl aminopeptidase